MGIELYKTKTMTLLEAYDRGVDRVGRTLVTGTHCALTPSGKCVGCAMGAVFLGANTSVPCPTDPEQAEDIDNLTAEWRVRHHGLQTATEEVGDDVWGRYAEEYSPHERAFEAIQDFNDSDRTAALKGSQPLWMDSDLKPRDPEAVSYETKVSVDKVRRFIIKEGYADILVHVAKPSTLPRGVLV